MDPHVLTRGARAERDRLWIHTKRLRLVIIVAALEITTSTALAASATNLSSAVIRGSSVYTQAELFELYQDQLGIPITRESAQAVVQRLAEKYRSDGYSRPQIRIDAGLIEFGVLRVDVHEARIANVVISGDPGPHRARLEQLAATVEQRVPVRQSDLQAALRRMRELPGLSVSAATMEDASEPNVYRLEVATDFEPLSGAVRVTNRGTQEIGPNFVLGQVVANGALRSRSNVGLLFGVASDYDEYRGLGALARTPIGAEGGDLNITAFRSRSDPSESGTDRDLHYVRDRLSVRVAKPLDATGGSRISVSATLALEDLAIDRSGALLRDERLRMLELGGRWGFNAGETSRWLGLVDVVKGLGGLGSGLDAVDLETDGRRADFTLLRLGLTRSTRFGEHWTTRLDAFAQQSAYVLPYSERFKIGGDRLGRGFEVAEIAGDQGMGAKIELRRRLPNAPRLLGRASVYGFYDIAAAWKQDAPGRESAATGGFGSRFELRKTSAYVELAQPLTHPDVEGRNGLTVFFELTTRL